MNLKNKIVENKNLFFSLKNIYVLLFSLSIFGLDRISKIEIINNFSDRTYFINEYLNFDLVWNTGIGFGLFSYDTSLIYNLISTLIILIVISLLYIASASKKIDKLIFSIIAGGGMGNLYDRLFYKAVPDFIDLHYSNFHWFTFNIADIFITIGILAFVVKDFFVKIK